MGKSLTETARAVLMKEGVIPSVSSTDVDPARDTPGPTPNAKTLRPGSKTKEDRFANPGSNPPVGDAEDLGGATPTSLYSDNLGAKASAKMNKDTSKASKSSVPSEPSKSLAEDEEIDEENYIEEEIELSEELEAFIEECIENGLTEEEIAEAIEENFELIEEDSDELSEEDKETVSEEEQETVSEEEIAENRKAMMKEHVDALLEGEQLSEEFRSKAETIFESAVNSRVKEEVTALEKAYAESLAEEVQQIQENLKEHIDDYLNYVVENWISENEVAIEAGLRTELTEEFITGLKHLFTEHYIEIPEEKIPVVETLTSELQEVKTKLNEEIARNVELNKVLNEAKQFEILVSSMDGLTDTQAEKLKSLAESVEYTSEEEYTKKINTLKESYFGSKAVNTDNVLDKPDADNKILTEEVDGRMGTYVRVLGKTLPKSKK